MKDEALEAIERLFHEARELKGEDRDRFLGHECGADIALRHKIEMLLEEDETAAGFLDTPMLDMISTALSPGTVLGPYEVIGVAGIGAIGQVYRAHDRRLNRAVAIKALPAEFTLAGEPLARLQREATLLASVNHPNVATIYDVLERDAADSFLILEFVEGSTLAERLSKGPVPLDEALDIARQIALALEAAHEKGIVHRDLKPANIKLTPNGIVKILDFGLAKVFIEDLTEADPSATGLVRNSSNTNSSFRGTPAYMSPEQVVGTAVDHRADIWAFGCVVFELLTGRRAFEGNTVSATSASILNAEPDWNLLPGSTPLPLRHLLQQSLQKDAKRRPPSASSLRRKIESHSTSVLGTVVFPGEPKQETLADRLERGPFPLDQALRCAIEIAGALDKAHRQGITHLDLKPRNILLTKSGAKLVDFGPATPVPVERMPVDPTDPKGITLGTLQYMTPEQVEGKDTDPRTDIFALGSVLYEMVTAHKAFQGTSEASLMAAILEHEPPPMSSLKAMTPPSLERIVRVCLAKDPEDRWQSARDLCRQLKWVAESDPDKGVPGQEPHSMQFSPAGSRTLRRPSKWLLALLIASVIGSAFVVWNLRGIEPAYRSTTRLLLDVQPAERFMGSGASTRPSRTVMAFSPDGHTVVFSGIRGTTYQLFKRELDKLEASPIAGTERARQPLISPDGQWVGFFADSKLRKVPIGGGLAVVICDVQGGAYGANWGPGDTIVFSNGADIFRVPAGGGTPSVVTKREAGDSTGAVLPYLLPGGKVMLYTVLASPGKWEQANVVAQSLETGERRTLIQGGADARYVSTGHLVYIKTGKLMAVSFDPTRLEVTGSPVTMVDNVMQAVGANNSSDETGAGQFSVSSNGTMAYLPGGLYPMKSVEPVWVDRKGVVTPIPNAPRSVGGPRISPDGERIAFYSRAGQSTQTEIWVYDIRRQNTARLTFQGNNKWLTWSPDNKSIVFTSVASGKSALFRVSADGGSMPEPLTSPETFTLNDYPQVAAAWSPANRMLAFLEIHNYVNGVSRIWVQPTAGDLKPKPFYESRFGLMHADFSPDGRWLAYSSRESGGLEVWVQPYPGPGAKIRISTNGGTSPVWARNGRELFYQRGASPSQLWVVDIDTSKGLYASKPRLLFEGNYGSSQPVRGYDVSPDGQLFLMTKAAGNVEPPFTQMHIVQNWTEELKRRTAAK